MHNHLWYHAKQKVLEQTGRKAENGPVMAILHYVEGIALEVDKAIKIHLVESLHRYLVLAPVSHPVLLPLKGEVVLHWFSRDFSFLVQAWREARGERPEED